MLLFVLKDIQQSSFSLVDKVNFKNVEYNWKKPPGSNGSAGFHNVWHYYPNSKASDIVIGFAYVNSKTTQEIIPHMEKRKSGSIINIASMYGVVSPDPRIYKNTKFNSSPQYGAGKAAIIQFTKYSACHLGNKNIRVNSVSPGPFPNSKIKKNLSFIKRLNQKTPLGRVGNPEELKGVILFLASNASSYVTGANIPVDGGWTAW